MILIFDAIKNKIINLIVSGIIFILIDSVYLYTISNKFIKMIENIQKEKIYVNIFGVLYCYIILILAFNYFVLHKKFNNMDTFLLGITIYGVYETTNYAFFKNWNISFVIMDTLWGGVLFLLTKLIFIRLWA